MKKINTIIFDLGGVLIDWNPEYVFKGIFNNDHKKMRSFLDNICTSDWNENQDAGYPIKQGTEDLVSKFPEYKFEIEQFYSRWEEMIGGPIQGTVNILDSLMKNDDFKVVALTNWSSETFPIALKMFEFLNWFDGIVVSGDEKTRKPFKEIYDICLNRFDIIANQAIFIDDNLRNIKAAKKLGINGIHYENPKQLKVALKAFNIKV